MSRKGAANGVPQKALQDTADELAQAHDSKMPIPPISGRLPGATIADAYAIQDINTRRWSGQGRTPVGRKVGLTSHAVQQALGIDQPDFGILFADMGYCDSEPIPLGRLIQPRIEGEVAFCLGRDLEAPVTLSALIRAIDHAVPALEVVDSRIADWEIGIVDTVADNASSGVFVLGTQPVKLDRFDHRLCGMVLELDGEPMATGAGAACLGNPLAATLWLARKMMELERPLRAGDIVLSGALGPLVPVREAGAYQLRINGIGAVRAVFEEAPR